MQILQLTKRTDSMKRHVIPALSLYFCMFSLAAEQTSVLQGATIIDGKGGIFGNGVVVVQGDRIQCVGKQGGCDIPANATSYDFSNHFITPGLIDAHVHFGQTGWLDGRPESLKPNDIYSYPDVVAYARSHPERWHKSYLCSGITAVYDVGGQSWTVTDKQATDTDRPDRARVRATGPLTTYLSDLNRFYALSDGTSPVFLPMDTDEQVRANVAHIKEIGGAAVKVWFLAPPEGRERELAQRLMLLGKLAKEAGLPMIVHATELHQAKAALRAGAQMLVHSVDDKPVDDEFIELLLANKTFYAPTLGVSGQWRRAVLSIALQQAIRIDDPNGCVDDVLLEQINHPERLTPYLTRQRDLTAALDLMQDTGFELAIMSQNLIRVHKAGGQVLMATDAGNPLTLHGPSVYWEMEAMQKAGLSPMDIIVAATLNGAKVMQLDDDIGSLEVGKMADLLVLTKDPSKDVSHFRSLSHVMRKGVLKSQQALRVRN